MTVILNANLEVIGMDDVVIVDPWCDYAYLAQQDRIAGSPKSADANNLLDQAQMCYRLCGWGSDVVIVDVHDSATVTLYLRGQRQLSVTSPHLADAVCQVEIQMDKQVVVA